MAKWWSHLFLSGVLAVVMTGGLVSVFIDGVPVGCKAAGALIAVLSAVGIGWLVHNGD